MNIGNFNLNEHVFIIAELSANHGQKLKIAIETIKAAKWAGANAIKLQTYTADSMTIDCKNDYFTKILDGSIWEGHSLYELYKEAYTPWKWHKELFHVAHEEGLICFSTPFDKNAVDLLEQFNPPAYKIASFEIQDIPLIEYTASKGKPMIISTGVAEFDDIQLAVETCHKVGNNNIALLKCTSQYPATIENANLLTIPDIKKHFGAKVGVSDHTMGSLVPTVAVSLGATVVEKHFILDRKQGGPDSAFSMEPQEFKEMVGLVRQVEAALGKITYDVSQKDKNLRRSLFVVKNIKAGETFTEKNIRSIRPGYGLHPKYLKDLLGKKAKKDIKKGVPLDKTHFE